MRKILTIFVAILMVVGAGSAAFQENMDHEDEADANVDRPAINHLKSFLNEYLPPVYNLVFGDR